MIKLTSTINVSSESGTVTIRGEGKTVILNHGEILSVKAHENSLSITTAFDDINFMTSTPEEAQEAKEKIVELVR